jgi:tRNA A37 methylthiotransferase MiaB
MAVLTLQQRLERAEQAYHDLMVGQSVRVLVDQNGERIEYTAANSAKLSAYIQSLRAQLSPRVNSPARVWL